MGQRTAILLKKNYGNNRSTITLIHHQWGIGKTMPAYLMQEFLKCSYPLDRRLEYIYIDEKQPKLPIDFFFTFEPLNNKDNNYITNKEVATDDENENIWNREVRIRYGEMTDNNNGMMLVEVTQKYNDSGSPKTYGNMFDIKVGFVLGYEETNFYHSNLNGKIILEQPFDRLVSIEEFATRTYGGSRPQVQKYTKKFVKACRTVMELEDVTEVYDKDGEKARNEKEEHIKNCLNALTEGLPEGKKIEVPEEFKPIYSAWS